MKKAKMKDFDTIWSEFKKNRDVFPHIRTDYLKRQIKNNNVIYYEGVILIFGEYKRRGTLGDFQYNKGDLIIHQILNSRKGNGNARIIMNRFITANDTQSRSIILSVRSANTRARRFYEKMGMSVVGNISWSKGTIGGKIYGYEIE